MKIILFVLLFVSAQIEVHAQQKKSKKSWASRETPVEVIEAKNIFDVDYIYSDQYSSDIF